MPLGEENLRESGVGLKSTNDANGIEFHELLRGALYCLHFSITIFKFCMNDPPLAKGDIGGFSKPLNPPLPPFSKGGDANKYMLRVILFR